MKAIPVDQLLAMIAASAAAAVLPRTRMGGRSWRYEGQNCSRVVPAATERPRGRRDADDARAAMLTSSSSTTSGGVNGRKIEWIVENDSYNPQQTAAVVKKLVDRDEVSSQSYPLLAP